MLNNELINYHGPGQAVFYCHHLTKVYVFKVLESSIYSASANLTVTDDVYNVDYSALSSFVFAGADGVFFVGEILEVMAGGDNLVYVKFKALAIATPKKKSIYVVDYARE